MTLTSDWDGGLYSANTAHHRRYDAAVLAGLTVPADGSILDLGCGVGDLTARLADLVPHGTVVGVDAAKDMVDTARAAANRPNLRFTHARAQELDRVTEPDSYDAVVSVAALHWIPAADHQRVLTQVARVLRPGGVLRAEFGGAGQIERTRSVLDAVSQAFGGGTSPWYFPTAEEYAVLLGRAGFTVGAVGAGATDPETTAVPAADTEHRHTTDGRAGDDPDVGGVPGVSDISDPVRTAESAAGPADPPIASGSWVRIVRQRREFPDERAFVGWLRSQVLIAYDTVVPAGAVPDFRRSAEERALRELRRADGTFDQDYVRLDLRAVLPISL